MGWKRFKSEDIVNKLRETTDALLTKAHNVAAVCKQIGVTEFT